MIMVVAYELANVYVMLSEGVNGNEGLRPRSD